MRHICVSNIIAIGSDDGWPPGRCQAIIWTNAGILLIGPLGINFSEILIEISKFIFKKMHLNMSSAKWPLFLLSPNESYFAIDILSNTARTFADKVVTKYWFHIVDPTKPALQLLQNMSRGGFQGWGQFNFFQFNSNSNSVIFNSNSNSNSTTHNKFQFQFQFWWFQFRFQFRRFQIPQSQFWKWPVDVLIPWNYTSKVHAYKIIVIDTISLISLVKWL